MQDAGVTRPILHPLAGAGIGTLVRLAIERGIAPRYWPQYALMLGAAVTRWPMCAVEAPRARRLARAWRAEPAPVFIVGHWRSGTTYLHNLMSLDPAFAFPTVAEIFRPLEFLPSPLDFISRGLLLKSLPSRRPMDDMRLGPDLPQEEEFALAAMGAPSFLNCLYFPRDLRASFERDVLFRGLPPAAIDRWSQSLREFLAKLDFMHGGRRLLLKNPADSARLPRLVEMFPGARFVHLHRAPNQVLASMRHFHRSMLPLVALQDYDLNEVDAHVTWAYVELMHVLLDDLERIPANRAVSVGYDDLCRDPRATVERIYTALDIEGFDGVRDRLDAYIAGEGAPRVSPRHTPSDSPVFDSSETDAIARRLGYASNT